MSYRYQHHWRHQDALDAHLVVQRPAAVDPPARLAREPLSAAAVRLCEKLRTSAPMSVTARDYPHVANRIADAWHDATRFRELMNSLLISDRHGREGFPMPVVMELAAIQEYRLEALKSGGR